MNNQKANLPATKPLGFDVAALVLTFGLSRDAASKLKDMIRSVASQYPNHQNDSAMINTLNRRLASAARRQSWAAEVVRHLAEQRELRRMA